VRVIFTDDVADDARRLAIAAVISEAVFVGRIEDPAVNGLEAVANVGQRPADDDAHRIVEVAGLHLLDDGDGGDVAFATAIAAVMIVFAVLDRRFGGQVILFLS